jgi:hypothetical protein
MVTTLLETAERQQVYNYLASIKVYPKEPKFIKHGDSLTKCHPFQPNRPISLDRVIVGLLRMRQTQVTSLNWIASHNNAGDKGYTLLRCDTFRCRIDVIDELLESFGYDVL